MSYTVKNGKIIREKHDQSRVDRFCRAIKDLTIPISEAEALNPKGGVVHITCAHEDWCQTMKGDYPVLDIAISHGNIPPTLRFKG